MALKSFKSVTQHINGVRSRRLHRKLKEDVVGSDILDAKVVTIGSNASPEDRELSIKEFIDSVGVMYDSGATMILTAITC